MEMTLGDDRICPVACYLSSLFHLIWRGEISSFKKVLFMYTIYIKNIFFQQGNISLLLYDMNAQKFFSDIWFHKGNSRGINVSFSTLYTLHHIFCNHSNEKEGIFTWLLLLWMSLKLYNLTFVCVKHC